MPDNPVSLSSGDPPNFLKPIVGLSVPNTLDAGPASSLQQRSFHSSSRSSRPLDTSSSHADSAMAHLATISSSPSVSKLAKPLSPSTDKGSDVQRINIGVFGVMNAGKSTLINRITRQETSIVDATPGTTADVKVALMELHDVGPAKLFDTAGIDEAGELGEKKRHKTLSTLKVCLSL